MLKVAHAQKWYVQIERPVTMLQRINSTVFEDEQVFTGLSLLVKSNLSTLLVHHSQLELGQPTDHRLMVNAVYFSTENRITKETTYGWERRASSQFWLELWLVSHDRGAKSENKNILIRTMKIMSLRFWLVGELINTKNELFYWSIELIQHDRYEMWGFPQIMSSQDNTEFMCLCCLAQRKPKKIN